MNKLRWLALAVVSLAFAPPLLAAEAKDLVGVWTLCHDPDHSPRDFLHLEADGSGSVVREGTDTIELLYVVDGSSLTLLAHVGENAIEIPMTISDDVQRLMAYSETSKHTSTYVREAAFATSGCTIE
jgi:hypothetical protein